MSNSLQPETMYSSRIGLDQNRPLDGRVEFVSFNQPGIAILETGKSGCGLQFKPENEIHTGVGIGLPATVKRPLGSELGAAYNGATLSGKPARLPTEVQAVNSLQCGACRDRCSKYDPSLALPVIGVLR